MQILYQDNHIIVVNKPVNMPVQKDASRDLDLHTALKAYIKQKYDKPGDVYLGIVHRLDRPVGGVMVFARTSKAASRLSLGFRLQQVDKHYLAVVAGSADSSATLTDYLLKGEGNMVKVVDKNHTNAKQALLSYSKKAEKDGLSLLDVKLYTGRPHQIRVQLANAGLPIWGDARYNKGAKAGQQIALCCYKLCFSHPTLKDTMCFTAPLPFAYPWNLF
jgi:23S rRNA pseudouridine1911/1915/1917 synthase